MNRRSALIIGYARAKETFNLIEVLINKKLQVYLSLDGPKTKEVKDIQELLTAKIVQEWGNCVHIRRSPINYGVGCGVISGIDWFFSETEQGLIFEDDLSISDAAIDFLELGLEQIKLVPKALMVTGSNFSIQDDEHLRVSWTHIPLIWGWATTRDKWELMRSLILEPLKLSISGISSPALGYFQGAAQAAMTRETDTWDSPLALRMLEKSYLCLMPPVNLIKNVGVDSFAVHTSKDIFPLFNPIRELRVEETKFFKPDELEVEKSDEKLFREVFKIKQRHRVSGILGYLRVNHKNGNSLAKAVRTYCDEGNSRITLVLVHLGRRIPRILYENIRYLVKLNNFKIVLITNARIRKRENRVLAEVRLWDPNLLLDGWVNRIQSNFRGGFWDKSKARLYILMNFYLLQNGERIMHIENDVWLSPKVKHEKYFEKGKIRFARITDKQASGAIMYLGTLSETAIRTMKALLIEGAEMTDMTILAEFSNRFPDLYEELDSKLDESKDGVIFDPAMVGMHLFGEDSRNRFGKARVFAPYNEHGYKFDLYEFGFKAGSLSMVDMESNSYEIANLHLHSKDRRLFKDDWQSVLSNQIVKRKNCQGEVETFNTKGMLLALFDYIRLLPSFLIKKYLSWTRMREVKS